MALLKETSRQVNILTNNERATRTVRKQKRGLVTLEVDGGDRRGVTLRLRHQDGRLCALGC